MSPATASASAPRPAAAPASALPSSAARWIAALIPAAMGAWVFRSALAYFFSQDDFLGLARARGLAPPLAGPWRWISGQLYFALMRPFGTESAAAYHAVSLLAHGAAAALLAVLLARRVSVPAALLGAAFFAVHPSLYTALYSVSGIGEILSGLFVLATLLLASSGRPTRWLALAAFAAALLSKESVLLLPLVLLGGGGRRGAPAAGARARLEPGRDVAWALAVLSAMFAAVLFFSDVFAVRSGPGARAPYAFSPGMHVLANLTTYIGWAVQPWLPLAHGFQDALDASVAPAAVIAVLLFAAGMAWPRLRATGWRSGAALFLLLLAPVLALRNHTYHYYLYAPLIGISMALAALAEVALGALPGGRDGRAAWGTALALAALFTWNGAAFVHQIETHPFTDPRLRADALVDRALIARRVTDGLEAARLPEGTPLVFWSPWALLEQAHTLGGTAGQNESYAEANVRAALMDGLAVRVLFPQLGEVSFLHQYRSPLPPARVALYDADGTLRVSSPAQVDSMLSAHPIPGGRP
jgi:hypothetical protein